ncbi:glycolate oxidase subunit, FAD-linked [Candidatus Filomicrobium marinum]|uniref:Glycolate oxidase subunit, FAD-linked n=1 Tax=Candidatus Filomicrobium marinum TaxID=1608628 RepID=A0A0D6J9M8_9HYPH|nr:FAD-linked oxidase C-terminal domain-containing protein [Candidatus Filomicrobium marinum]CFW99292.1 glycolate oxidase subunit, FAD-linked [Candidatus Filomicrobium marinum]CPR15031.1 glycolate oxidase subunit, FAD-linked [Candidatus Filomicrobium marinum]
MTHLQMPTPDASVLGRSQQIIKDLTALAGAEAVIADEEGRRTFETDGLTAYRCMPLAVVLPTTTEEVSRILKYCHREGIKVVARGAGTSLCGGALPVEDAVVVGVSRMNRVLEIDYDNRFIRVETGITNLGISGAVSAEGFFYAPDPSSQLACTLAGNLGMNSGGAHCLKYGVTTNNVLGLKVVLMDGEVIELGGGHLDAEGYDLIGLMIGSEGQFGIVTEATVRILKAAEGARPMLMGFGSSEAAGACVAGIIGAGIVPVAMEFMDKPAIEVCEAFAKAGYPLDVEALLIIEVEGSDDEISEMLGRIQAIAEPFGPTSILISQSAEQSAKIWKGRKSAFGAIGRISDYYCMDGTIPLSRLPDVLRRIGEICEGHGLKVANIFHAGDGNLHPLILYDANDPSSSERAELAGADILRLCVEVGGCLTGEHGVGVEKRDLMNDQFSATDLTVQIRVKTVFDPKWLLNPGKVFPLNDTQQAKDVA